jgi:dTDP-4-amino-4,6-dideoxygalactose transaminase
MINVTKTFLPPQSEYQAILEKSWKHAWITNRGPLVLKLEAQLKKRLGVSKILATTNGTLPIQIAIKSLELKGEIITTPFSYAATTSSIVWEDCLPVYVDIHPDYLTIDETKIEAAITSKTTAILATHVFGNPCAVESIETIAKKHNLKVIYDAAHCFDVTYKGQSIFNYGDVSTCSFHATKIFHTAEGGALFCNDTTFYEKLFYHHNFGHNGPEAFQGIGTNAKMSELQGAMGLSLLPYMDVNTAKRKAIVETYNKAFGQSILKPLKIREQTEWNYCYYPVLFQDNQQMLKVLDGLKKHDIFARRYFYPSLNTLPYLEFVEMPVSESVASRILCLPLYPGLLNEDVERIIFIILKEI